jgi:FMN phosphatase YigB (HAD superfamily)
MIGRKIKAVFLAPGATLGQIREERLFPFPWTLQLLAVLRSVLNLRLGIITNLPPEITPMQLKQLLIGANLLRFLDSYGFITSVEAKVLKPDPRIYLYAAEQMGFTPSQCLYIGEDDADVEGACAAGMVPIMRDRFLTVGSLADADGGEEGSAAARLY